MNRTLGIERVFSLGDYKSLRAIDTITEIPEDLLLNQEAVDYLKVIQLASIDLTYQKYIQMTKEFSKYPEGSEDKYTALLEYRETALNNLLNLINKEK